MRKFLILFWFLALIVLVGCEIPVVEEPELVEITESTEAPETAWEAEARIKKKYSQDMELIDIICSDPVQGLEMLGIESDRILGYVAERDIRRLFLKPSLFYAEIEQIDPDGFISSQSKDNFIEFKEGLASKVSAYDSVFERYNSYYEYLYEDGEYTELFGRFDELRKSGSEEDWETFCKELFVP
ncbi:hypothetical protein IJG71_02340 [Candidatus Saccharibacteria bacterium]|nr:hypothetical protein [Candidatus Saccharibacteria bacterium]